MYVYMGVCLIECSKRRKRGTMAQKSQMAAESLGTGQQIFFCTPGSRIGKMEDNLTSADPLS